MHALMEKGILPALFLLVSSQAAFAFDTSRPEIKSFIDRMVEEHSYDRAKLESVLTDAESKESILEAIARPAERTLEWHEYRDIFLKSERINAGMIGHIELFNGIA